MLRNKTQIWLQNTKKQYKTEKKFTYRDSNPDPRKRSTTTQRAASWATMPVGGIAANSCNELTYIIIIIIIIKHIYRAHFRGMPQMRWRQQLHVK